MLGHGNEENQWQPKRIEALAGHRGIAVSTRVGAGRAARAAAAGRGGEVKSHKAEADLATYRWLATQAAAMLNASEAHVAAGAVWLAPLMSYGRRVSLRLRLWAPAQ
mmetsp:Transcript_41460/g.133324  ORF Transcript_41460/g.133324 Transcript_41460/m.133324 type:complete len:107 (-) Transcript_41460:310-630(-)